MIPLDEPLLFFRDPLIAFPFYLVLLSLAAWAGVVGFKQLRRAVDDAREDFRIIQGATLTLLALIVGFSFSMALERYDQRKNLEEQEANAIGTEYVRADLLPPAAAARVRELLKTYIGQRILFYTTRDHDALAQINDRTMKLQAELWAAVVKPANDRPDPVMALVVNGMNDVLNSQGYTQAAWWNRIPLAAWLMLTAIAVCASLLDGIGAKDGRANFRMRLVLPLVFSIAFFLIADIDSPRRGAIRVIPQNLMALLQSL